MGGTRKAGGKPFMLDALGVTQRLRLGVGLRSEATPAPHPDDRGRLVPPSGGRRGENATSETRRRAKPGEQARRALQPACGSLLCEAKCSESTCQTSAAFVPLELTF